MLLLLMSLPLSILPTMLQESLRRVTIAIHGHPPPSLKPQPRGWGHTMCWAIQHQHQHQSNTNIPGKSDKGFDIPVIKPQVIILLANTAEHAKLTGTHDNQQRAAYLHCLSKHDQRFYTYCKPNPPTILHKGGVSRSFSSITYLNLMLRLPILLAVLLSTLQVGCGKDIAKVVVIVHCPNFNSRTSNIANAFERLIVFKIVWIRNLPRRPWTLVRTASPPIICG
jgi:hypothetical protein